MSEKYQLVRLGDLCNSISGLWTGKKPPFEKATVIRNTNFTKDCKLDLTDVAILDVETKQLQTRKLIPGDLIVEKSGGGPKQAVGRVVYFNETLGTFSLSNFTSALRIKDSTKADPRYLQHFLYYQYVSGVTETMQSNSTGIRNLNIHQFLDIMVPLPTLNRQSEIVVKLDSLFAEIEAAKLQNSYSIQNLSKLLDSKFEEVFVMMETEYGLVQSGTLIDVRDGTHDSPSYFDSGYPLITSKNLQNGLIDFEKVSFISKDDYDQINKRSKVETGDLLFAMIGTIGNPVVVKDTPSFAIKNVALFKTNPKYSMTFLSYYLRTPKMKEKFQREAKGTTQRFLGLGYLRTFDIPNVPIEVQIDIVTKLEQIESEIKKIELNLKRRLENFIELNNSILSSTFAFDSEKEEVA